MKNILEFEIWIYVTKILIFFYTVRKAFPELCLKYSQDFITEATETCNKTMEPEFCWIFGDSFENFKSFLYEA